MFFSGTQAHLFGFGTLRRPALPGASLLQLGNPKDGAVLELVLPMGLPCLSKSASSTHAEATQATEAGSWAHHVALPRAQAQVVLTALMPHMMHWAHVGGAGSGRLGLTCLPCSVGMGLRQDTGAGLCFVPFLGPCLQVRPHLGRCLHQPWTGGLRGGSQGHLLLQDAQHLVLHCSHCHSFCASCQAPRLAASCKMVFLFYI